MISDSKVITTTREEQGDDFLYRLTFLGNLGNKPRGLIVQGTQRQVRDFQHEITITKDIHSKVIFEG